MAKFTSILILAAAALASFSTAAPVRSAEPVSSPMPVSSPSAEPAASLISEPVPEHNIPAASPISEPAPEDSIPAPSHPAAEASALATIKVAASVDPNFDYSQFSTSNTFTGKATWFEGSFGACGIKWDGSESIIALNAHQMGPSSYGNPACNKRVQITNTANGKTVTARILDKCPGDECAYGSLDLSPAAFRQIGDQATGVLNIAWHYL
ncbi:hypothetical protein BGZ73_006570 [Actinomortierella ambigua]|nr:hypothetical protein BGZ73_006570 [Actinomortierella ambigua]